MLLRASSPALVSLGEQPIISRPFKSFYNAVGPRARPIPDGCRPGQLLSTRTGFPGLCTRNEPKERLRAGAMLRIAIFAEGGMRMNWVSQDLFRKV